MTRLRPALRDMPGYVPGRRPAPGQSYARLASNETSFGPLPGVVEAAAAAVREAHRYPDPTAAALVAAIGEHNGVDLDRIAVGCGSVSLIQDLLHICVEPGDEVVYGWRSFEAYPVMTHIAGASHAPIPLHEGHFDLDAMTAAVTDRTRLLLLCSPNNPTGPALPADGVGKLLQNVPEDVVVVLDEAYAEFVTDPSAVDGRTLLGAHPNLVVLRTFSKAYGLAGLRAGYALGSPDVVAALRLVAVPFAVSVVAQAAAIASMQATEELARRVDTVVAQRERAVSAAREIGVPVPDAQGNFFWLPTGERAMATAAALEQHGVLSRPFEGDGVRVTVTDEAETDVLIAAMQASREVLLGDAVAAAG
ncbi:MAG TPA: histidinol-phosphate transaminase [Mycobacteriales bacterium]|nr:histidinol-phosphate transaminase [Mycobacteriales bacterium]